MAKPYSMDLRERAIARLDAGESVRTVAMALSVAPSLGCCLECGGNCGSALSSMFMLPRHAARSIG